MCRSRTQQRGSWRRCFSILSRRTCLLNRLVLLGTAIVASFSLAVSSVAAKDDGANGLRGPIFNKLNTTGRVLDLPIPVKDGRMDLGEVTIRLNPDDSVLVHVPLLVQLLDKALSDKARQTLLALGGPFVAIERIVEAGFQVKFDTALQELGISLTADQRPVGDIYIGSRKPAASTHLAEPAQVSAYLNIIGGLDWVWGHRESDSFLYSAGDSVIGRLDLESAIRISGAVFENRAVYKSSYEAFLCRDVASCNLAFEPGFQRLSSRVVYDMPSHALRWIAGDNDALGIGPQGTPEFLGLSVEKAPAKFGDAASLRPSPKSTFRIDRPSDIEVQINGVTLHRMHLQPGTYNVRDLPVAAGANEIELRITDASGETRTQKLTAYYDTRLLRAGASEWALLAGVPSALLADERIYSQQSWFGSGFIRFGLSDGLTLEGHARRYRADPLGCCRASRRRLAP
jgi:outer membrane usher protein